MWLVKCFSYLVTLEDFRKKEQFRQWKVTPPRETKINARMEAWKEYFTGRFPILDLQVSKMLT